VVVDVRPDSDTFRRWVGVMLSGENHRQLWCRRIRARVRRAKAVDRHVQVTAPYDSGIGALVLWSDEDRQSTAGQPISSLGEGRERSPAARECRASSCRASGISKRV